MHAEVYPKTTQYQKPNNNLVLVQLSLDLFLQAQLLFLSTAFHFFLTRARARIS